MRRLRRSTSFVWNYFDQCGEVSAKTATCKFCKNILSYKSTITNLKLHLRKRHIDVYEVYCREELAAKSQGEGSDAKLQWKKLRDSHREVLRHQKPNHGPTWPRKFKGNIKCMVPQTESNDKSVHSNESIDLEEHNAVDTPNLFIELPHPALNPFPQDSTSGTNQQNINQDKRQNNNSLLSLSKTPAVSAGMLVKREKLRAHREKLKENRKMRDRDELLRQVSELHRSDALSKFFDSLCQKTRELPRYLQLRVQREVFDSVTRAEEEALSLSTSSTNEYRPAPSTSTQPQSSTIVSSESQEEEEDYVIEPKHESRISFESSP